MTSELGYAASNVLVILAGENLSKASLKHVQRDLANAVKGLGQIVSLKATATNIIVTCSSEDVACELVEQSRQLAVDGQVVSIQRHSTKRPNVSPIVAKPRETKSITSAASSSLQTDAFDLATEIDEYRKFQHNGPVRRRDLKIKQRFQNVPSKELDALVTKTDVAGETTFPP